MRKDTLSKEKVFLQMLGFVPVRKQVMENALRMGQTAVSEYFCGTGPYHWAQENLHTAFKINREFSESSHNQKKFKKIHLNLHLKSSENGRTLHDCWILHNLKYAVKMI